MSAAGSKDAPGGHRGLDSSVGGEEGRSGHVRAVNVHQRWPPQ